MKCEHLLKNWKLIVLMTLLLVGTVWTSTKSYADDSDMNSELTLLLEKNMQIPIKEALLKLGPVLFQSEIILPEKRDIKAEKEEKRTISLLTGKDKLGREWFYVYTNTKELLKVFPQGAKYVAMNFSDFLQVIESKTNVGGIYFNSGSDRSAFPIPSSFFHDLRKFQENKNYREKKVIVTPEGDTRL